MMRQAIRRFLGRLGNPLCVLLALGLAGCVTVTSSPSPRPSGPNPEAAEANLSLGISYLRQEKWELAREKLEKSVSQDDQVPTTHSALALVYQELGEIDLAENHYARAVKLEPNNSAALNSYGVFLCTETRRHGEAEGYFNRAAENKRYSTPEVALTNAGVCMLGVDDKAKAESYFRRALERNPRFPDALIRMTNLAVSNDNYLQARAFLERSLVSTAATAPLLWLGYQIETELGDEQRAQNYATQLKSKFIDSDEARQLLELESNDG